MVEINPDRPDVELLECGGTKRRVHLLISRLLITAVVLLVIELLTLFKILYSQQRDAVINNYAAPQPEILLDSTWSTSTVGLIQ